MKNPNKPISSLNAQIIDLRNKINDLRERYGFHYEDINQECWKMMRERAALREQRNTLIKARDAKIGK